MPLPGLPRGLMLMQTQARFSSLELGANSTGTSTLDPSVICNPTAKVGNSHRHVGQVTHTCARTHIHTHTKVDLYTDFSDETGYWIFFQWLLEVLQPKKSDGAHKASETVDKEMKKEMNACETVNRTPPT